MMDEQPGTSSKSEVDTDEIAKKSLAAVLQFVRSTHGFPAAGDDYEFYSSFSGFRDFVADQKARLLNGITKLLSNQGLKKNFGTSSTDIEEYTDCLVECNDGLLERVSVLIDECSGIRKAKETTENSEVNLSRPSVDQPKTVVSSWNRIDKKGKSKTFRLMQAHNIIRPQLKFKDKIDNSNSPFVPKIIIKPNGIKPLSKSLLKIHKIEGHGEDNTQKIDNLIKQARNLHKNQKFDFEHPYKFELDNWVPMDTQLQKVVPQKYSEIDPNAHILVDTKQTLYALLSDLKTQCEFAVDLEHHSYRSFQGITCLMQISTRKQDYVVDTLTLRSELYILNEVFTNPKIVKVFHGSNSDILWLQRDFGIYVVNLFDTGAASHLLQLERHSLKFLLHYYCNLELDKRFQLADWRIRPLPEELVAYAVGDTHCLLYLYDLMRNDLLDKASGGTKLLRDTLSTGRDLCLAQYEKPRNSPKAHLHVLERRVRRGKGSQFNRQQMEALRLLHDWRDSMARSEDESPGYVLPNHMLLQIAEILPREAQGVLACCNPIPPLLRQHVLVVHRLVMDARAKPNFRPGSSSASQDVALEQPETKVPVPAKIDDEYGDMLRCPHDWSRGDSSQSNLSDTECKIRSKSASALFGPPDEKSLVNDAKFASTPPKPFKKAVRDKLKSIRQATWNPFDLYMPGGASPKPNRRCFSEGDLGETDSTQLTLRHMLSGDFVWKMRRMEEEPEKEEREKKSDEEEPKTFGKVVEIPDTARRATEEQVQVLRHMMGPKKNSSNGVNAERGHNFNSPSAQAEPSEPPSFRPSRGRGNFNRGFKRKRTPGRGDFVPRRFTEDDFMPFQRRGSSKKRAKR